MAALRLLILITAYVLPLVSATAQLPIFDNLRSSRPVPAQQYPARNRICIVNSHNDRRTDDSAYILSAIQVCNPGGHVVFLPRTTYVVGKALNITTLHHVDLDIQGTILFSNNTVYWQANAFPMTFQNATSFFILGGADVNVYGGGTVNGNGQIWYDEFATVKKTNRPILFTILGLKGGSVTDLHLHQSPFWNNLIANSSDVTYTNIDIFSYSHNGSSFEKNTDGWDVYRSNRIVIQNSTVTNGDDCVSFKPNSTNILVRNLHCNGTHGVSVGSLGQYPARIDIVENIHVTNISMFNSSEGAGIKVWPETYSEKSAALTGGGGTGRVRNVTFENMFLDNVDYGLTITQCYGAESEELCFKHPSRLNITDVTFRNIHGRTNRVFAPIVGHLVCSSPTTCSNITATNINIRSVNGSNIMTCQNLDRTKLALPCTSWSKGYNQA